MALASTRTIEIGFSSNPGTAIGSTTWTDVTADVRHVTTKRGRQRELDQFAAGTATVVLNNRTRRYDPLYTGAGAPYNGNIVPMRRIRIRGVYNAVTYDVFSGFIDGWEQHYDPPREATATVTATDAFKVLANIVLPGSVYESEVRGDNPTSWYRLDEPVGSTILTARTGGRDLTVVGTPTLGAAGLVAHDPDTAITINTATDGAASAKGTTIATTYPMTLAAIVKTTSVAAQQIMSLRDANNDEVVTLASNGTNPTLNAWGGGVNGATTGTVAINDGAPHLVVGVWSAAGALTLYVDGAATGTPGTATGTIGNGSLPPTTVWIGGGQSYSGGVVQGLVGTLDEVVIFTTAVSAARIAAWASARATPWNGDLSGARVGRVLDAINWPAADRNINTGLSVLQSADLNTTALAALQKVEATEQALLFMSAAGQVWFVGRTELNSAPYTTSQATFGDSGAELRYTNIAFTYNDQLLYNEINVSRTGGTVQTASDATSQTSYLKRSQTLDGLLHNSDSASRDLANYRLAIYKDPLDRLTGLTIAPEGAPATLYPQVLGRELGDRITVKRRPQGVGSAISQDANIEGISHTITPDSWVTTWNLSPANVLQFWLAGVAGASEAGQTTRAAF